MILSGAPSQSEVEMLRQEDRRRFADRLVAIAIVDSRAKSPDRVKLEAAFASFRRRLETMEAREGQSYAPVGEIAIPANETDATGSWNALATGLFPGSRELTPEEAREFDQISSKQLKPLRSPLKRIDRY